jgi:hypothetical protein
MHIIQLEKLIILLLLKICYNFTIKKTEIYTNDFIFNNYNLLIVNYYHIYFYKYY